MSVAKVRIAPIERWCWFYSDGINENNAKEAASLVGVEISIKTQTMRQADCDPEARMWDATDESWKLLDSLCGRPDYHDVTDQRRGICEHVLEMD